MVERSMAAAPIPFEQVRRIRRVEYDKMVELGLFEGERVELLYGVIVKMSPKGPEHESSLERLNEILVGALAGRATVRIQAPFAASDGSEPEPDVSVVPRADHRKAHPSSAYLLIEVADSSLAHDRTIKAQLYAECGVPEYWIVNVRDRIVEVHTEIARGAYTRVVPFKPGQRVPIGAFPDVLVGVDDIL
jgi:Uma2 family endonuclease